MTDNVSGTVQRQSQTPPMCVRNPTMRKNELSLYAQGVASGKLRLMKDFPVGGNVLDLGCGNGLYGLHVAAMGCEVLQIDLVDRRDAKARHLPFQVMDAQQLDLPDRSFDHVLAFDVMEHLDDDVHFLQEVRRVCRRTLFLSVPNAEDSQLESLALTFIHHKDKTHRREYSREVLVCLLEQNGFRVVSIEPNFNSRLPFFAHALAKNTFWAKVAARLISLQCKVLQKVGLFENRSVGDWYCVAEVA